MSDLWQWFQQREAAYRANGDRERWEMAQFYKRSFELSETNPLGMARLNEQGRDLARRLGEVWWTFFYDVWIEIAYETHAKDLENGLKQALHCVLEARK